MDIYGGGGGWGLRAYNRYNIFVSKWMGLFPEEGFKPGGFKWDFTGIRSLSVQTYLRFSEVVFFTFDHQNLGFG